MASVAEMQARLASIEKALHSGQLRVQYHDNAITYRSADEMRSIMSELRDGIAAAGGAPVKRSIRMRQGGRGY